MTILAVGGEAECFQFVAGQAFAFESTGGRFISTASRYAMKVQQAVSEIDLVLSATATELWMHAYIYQESVGATDYIYFETTAGLAGWKIALESDGRYSVYKYSGASWGSALATSASPVLASAGGQIDVHLKINASGVFNVYKNGSAVVTYSGDTTGDRANCGQIHFYGHTSGSNKMDLSQVIVTDTVDTRGWVLATLTPNAVGDDTDWTGAYTDIADATYDETTYLSATLTAKISTFDATSIDASYTGATVKGVAVALRAEIDVASAITTLKAALRVSGTDYLSSTLAGPTNDAASHSGQAIWETDPSTSAAWASNSAVNAIEVGLKSA
jgi:hypothetical protein